MNSLDILDGITCIRDDLIDGAKGAPPQKRRHTAVWFCSAAAAVLISAILGSMVLGGLFQRSGGAPAQSEQKMYPIGKAWETEAFSFTVHSAALCAYYPISPQDTVLPDADCVFLAVECGIDGASAFAFKDCSIQKSDVYADAHSLHTAPIALSGGASESGDSYTLLFSVPRAELQDGTAVSYTMSVTMESGGKSYTESFSLNAIQDSLDEP